MQMSYAKAIEALYKSQCVKKKRNYTNPQLQGLVLLFQYQYTEWEFYQEGESTIIIDNKTFDDLEPMEKSMYFVRSLDRTLGSKEFGDDYITPRFGFGDSEYNLISEYISSNDRYHKLFDPAGEP